MKTKGIISAMSIGAVALTMVFHACNKEEDSLITSEDVALAQDELYMDAVYSEVDNLVESSIATLDVNNYQPGSLKSTEETPCVVVTVDHPDGVTFPKVVSIDYGDGCTLVFNNDTITYKGQIIITVTDRYFVPGAQRIITFNDFYINEAKIEGTRTVTNLGQNGEGHLEVQVTLANGKITFEDGTWATRTSTILREWVRKEDRLEDTLYVTGSSFGVNMLGEEYVREITDPIMWIHCPEYNYRWIRVDGTVTITNTVKGVTTIDFGDGTCENALILGKRGERYNLRFRYRHHRF
jgi:hypothetical protein